MWAAVESGAFSLQSITACIGLFTIANTSFERKAHEPALPTVAWVARNAKALARGPCWSRRWRGMTREGPELKRVVGFGLGRRTDHSTAANMPRGATAAIAATATRTARSAQYYFTNRPTALWGTLRANGRAFQNEKRLRNGGALANGAQWRLVADKGGQQRLTAPRQCKLRGDTGHRVPLATPSVP
jgi:hypothetical protein